MSFVTRTLTDQNDDGDVDRFNGDAIGGVDISASYPGDTVTISVVGVGNVTYTGITFYLADGGRVFTPTDGQVLQNGTFVGSTFELPQGPLDVGGLGPPCFVAGTLIETEDGPVAVEDIKVGQNVRTADHGLQPVRWHGSWRVVGHGTHAPIRFATGAIGNARPLLLSPQHMVLLSGWRAELLFGEDEVLVAACHLVNHDTIARAPARDVVYHHLMFETHEVIFSQGVPTESFCPGSYILGDDDVRAEIEALMPEQFCDVAGEWHTARPVVGRAEATVLCGDRWVGAGPNMGARA
ncbi:Hint domain-containing protein [Pseudooctadecabacter jejudonensis]|uniref:Hedgehog/Intein (Hint) domain-containing protein n=1 Tax=Pseudooctadecabacter jejudonensis TaxID=1391910 RepID=A0A1Y5S9G9_9RHOB|nr:Hint domain-containing protein [Pseudooctadecabacter jejudonensis]SLN34383.1 hypothetical protein PSJ8397_01692 [Pseudooctadecabacter jejudonensis]